MTDSRSRTDPDELLHDSFVSLLRRDPPDASAPTPRQVWLEMAGRPVRLTIVGARLADSFLRAYRHLLVDPVSAVAKALSPALDIEVWDEAECAHARPVRYLRDCLPHSRPFGRAVLGQSSDRRILGYQSYALFGVLNLDRNRLVAAVGDAGSLSLFERGKPLQPLLFAWHGAIGATPLHAGLVARGGRGVLLGGAGGSGKSTTSLLCWEAGFDYLGDDYIALPDRDPNAHYTGYSFYTSTWLTPEHSRRFPRLAERAHTGGEEDDKLLVLLNEVDDARLARSARVLALALPRVSGRPDTTFRRASRPEAILRLAPSSILQLPFIDGQAALNRMHALVRDVPAYWLELGTNLSAIPRTVSSLLEELDDA